MSHTLFNTLFFSIAFTIWIVYKMALRKKRFSEIRIDVITIACFIAINAVITGWVLK